MTEPKNGVKTLGIKLPDPVHAQLTLIASLDGLSLTDAIRQAIDLYIEHSAARAILPVGQPRRWPRSSGKPPNAGTRSKRCSARKPRRLQSPQPNRPSRPAVAGVTRRHNRRPGEEVAPLLPLPSQPNKHQKYATNDRNHLLNCCGLESTNPVKLNPERRKGISCLTKWTISWVSICVTSASREG